MKVNEIEIMRTQEEEISLFFSKKQRRRAHHLSTPFTDEQIQSVKHGPDCTAICRQTTIRFESVIPISEDGCDNDHAFGLTWATQRGFPTYP